MTAAAPVRPAPPSQEPLRRLRAQIQRYGTDVCLDSPRCAALLAELDSTAYPREVSYLLHGLRAGVPERLLQSGSADKKTLFAPLVQHVQHFAPGCERSWAVWIVHSWATALGVLTQAAPAPVGPSLTERPPAASAPPAPAASAALRDATLCVLQTRLSALGADAAHDTGPQALELIGIATGQAVQTGQGLERAYTNSRFSPDGKRLALSSWCRSLSVCDSDSGRELCSWKAGPEQIQSLAFSADGECLASGDWEGGVKLWRVADGSLLQAFRAHQGRVTALAFHPRGRVLASSGEDGAVRLWPIGHGPLRRRLHSWLGRRGALASLPGLGSKPTTLLFSPGGHTLSSASEDAQLWLWDMRHLPRTPSSRDVQVLQGHRRSVEVLAFSPDGGLLASAGWDKNILLWDVNNGIALRNLPGHHGHVTQLLFSQQHRRLLSVGRDHTLRVWDVAGGRQHYQISTGNFRPNSLHLAAHGLLRISGNFDKTLFDETTLLRLPAAP